MLPPQMLWAPWHGAAAQSESLYSAPWQDYLGAHRGDLEFPAAPRPQPLPAQRPWPQPACPSAASSVRVAAGAAGQAALHPTFPHLPIAFSPAYKTAGGGGGGGADGCPVPAGKVSKRQSAVRTAAVEFAPCAPQAALDHHGAAAPPDGPRGLQVAPPPSPQSRQSLLQAQAALIGLPPPPGLALPPPPGLELVEADGSPQSLPHTDGTGSSPVAHREVPTPPLAWAPGVTSLMIRNIPNRYTPEDLLDDMITSGFEGAFDFFYLPTDFGSKRSKGYAFVNLRSPELASRFRVAFDNKRLTRYSSQKVLIVAPADTQGFEANARKYLQCQAARVQNPWFKPMIFLPADSDDQVPHGAARWKCIPLSEEHLPEALREKLMRRPQPQAKACAPQELRCQEPGEPGGACAAGCGAGEDEGEDNDSPDANAEALVALQGAVRRFLQSCGGATAGALEGPAPTLDALRDEAGAEARPKVGRRRGGKRHQRD